MPNRLKKPAVATAAFCEARPTATPLSAAAPHGEAGFTSLAVRTADTDASGVSVADDIDSPDAAGVTVGREGTVGSGCSSADDCLVESVDTGSVDKAAALATVGCVLALRGLVCRAPFAGGG